MAGKKNNNNLKPEIRKKRRKKAVICVSVVTAGAVAGGIVFANVRPSPASADEQGSVSSAEAVTGTVTNTITGTGSLQAASGDAVNIPENLTFEKVCVSAGDNVKAGDVLAEVDHSSVLSAIKTIQEKIDSTDESIEDLSDGEDEDVTAKAGGTVTAVYGADGDSVTDVIAESGAVLEIAVDGDEDSVIQVTASDGTISDIDVSVGDTVSAGDTLFTVATGTDSAEYAELISERKELATLMQELVKISETDTITAPSDGTIKSVNISAESTGTSTASAGTSSSGGTASAGTSSSGTASLSSLSTVTSVDGETSGTESSSVTLSDTSSGESSVSDAGTAYSSGTGTAVLASYEKIVSSSASGTSGSETGNTSGSAGLVNESTSGAGGESTGGEDSSSDTGTKTQIDMDFDAGSVLTAPLAGNSASTEISTGSDAYSAELAWTETEDLEKNGSDAVPVKKFEAGKQYTASIKLTAKDGYSFGEIKLTDIPQGCTAKYVKNSDGSEVNITVTYPALSSGSTENGSENKTNKDSGSGSDSGSDSESDHETEKEGSSYTGNAGASGISGSAMGSGQASGSVSGTVSGVSSGSSSESSSENSTASDSSSDSSAQTVAYGYETAFEMEDDESMLIDISVDEQDINSVSEGQTATVTLDAIDGQTFEGTVTEVSGTASSSGNGSAKYTVEISIPKDDAMKEGMSASASIVVESSENVVTIPVTAIQERGNETYVYTSVDGDGNLSGETEIQTGLSDGDTVEVTEGLSDGDTVYYEKTGSTSSGSGNSSGGFGGEMPSGDDGNMPSDMNGGGTPPSGEMPSGNGGPSGGMPSGNTGN